MRPKVSIVLRAISFADDSSEPACVSMESVETVSFSEALASSCTAPPLSISFRLLESLGFAVHPVTPTFLYATDDATARGLSARHGDELVELRRSMLTAWPLREGEVPVFWACGVTPQAVAMASKPPLMITHAPGHMFLTDLKDEDLAVL